MVEKKTELYHLSWIWTKLGPTIGLDSAKLKNQMDKNENVNVRCDHFSLKWHRETKRKIFAEFARFFLTELLKIRQKRWKKPLTLANLVKRKNKQKRNKSCDLRTFFYSTFLFFFRCFIQKVNISYLIDDQKLKWFLHFWPMTLFINLHVHTYFISTAKSNPSKELNFWLASSQS